MIEHNIRTIRWITFFALLTLSAALLFPLVAWTASTALVGTLLIVIAAAFVTWALETWLRFLLDQFAQRKPGAEITPKKVDSREINLLLSETQALLSARSRRDVIEIVMKSGVSLLEADGASFVDFEEWGSPLQIKHYGETPKVEDGQWSEKLASPPTRQACRTCGVRESGAGCVLYVGLVTEPSQVICQALSDGHREVGVINFHFTSPVVISEEQKLNFNYLAKNGSIALNTLRNRELETIAFRDVQFSPIVCPIKDELSELCSAIQVTLDVDSVIFWFSDDFTSDHVNLKIYFDADSVIKKEFWTIDLLRDLANKAGKSTEFANQELNYPGEYCKKIFVLVYPTGWKQSRPMGLLLLVADQPIRLTGQQSQLLKVVAKEFTVLANTENEMDRLEIKAVGEERIRLAREIHDGLAQTLAYLKFQSAQMLTFLSSGKLDRLESALTANYQTLSEAYQDARYAIDNLRSMPDGDVHKWLLEQAAIFTDATGIPVDTTGLFIRAKVPLLVQAQLIRIIQEAFGNIRKHAKASKVVVSGSVSDDEMIIEITDNGTGFEPDMVGTGSKYGLVGMRERMDLIGGDFQIISKQGEGTAVRLTILNTIRVT